MCVCLFLLFSFFSDLPTATTALDRRSEFAILPQLPLPLMTTTMTTTRTAAVALATALVALTGSGVSGAAIDCHNLGS